jgi:hypothetical protein
MKRTVHFLSLALLVCSAAADAQVFKWVGPDGKTNYSDVPPGPTVVRSQKKMFTGNVVDTADMPFDLAAAVKNSPVTLYTGAKCIPCDDGRKLLNARGIPFSEKTVSSNADIALLGGSGVELPQLAVGSSKLRGFEAGAWNTSLTAGGYPESSKLPKTYRNPAAEAAAPAVKSEASAEPAPQAAPAVPKKPARAATPPTPQDSGIPNLRF